VPTLSFWLFISLDAILTMTLSFSHYLSMKTLELLIIGRVQGVSYRAETKRKASKLGLYGMVRNNDDGSVSCTVQGGEDALNEMVNWCKVGSVLSNVAEVQVREVDSPFVYSQFSIQ
jgi:acylphosphatase